jgi:hypothetical protein
MNNYHNTRRPLSYFKPEKDAEDRQRRGLPPRAIAAQVHYGESISAEAKQNQPDNILGMLKQGAKPWSFADPSGAGWNLEEYSYLRGWKEVTDLLSREPVFLDRPRSPLIEMIKLMRSAGTPEIVFRTQESTIHAHYFVLFQNATSLLQEYKLVRQVGDTTRIPSDLEASEPTIEVDVKEDALVFRALMEWIYSGAIRDSVMTNLQSNKLLSPLRNVAYRFKLSALAQACGRFENQQLPVFTAPPEPARFGSILCPYVDAAMSFDQKQLRRCMTSEPDMILAVENRFILVHSPLLVAASDYFGSLFSFNSAATRIELKDVSYDTAWSVVSYIYSGKLMPNPSISTILELQQYCMEILMPHMKEQCDKAFLQAELSSETVLDYLEAAVDMNLKELESKCLKFVGPFIIEFALKDRERFQKLIVPQLDTIYQHMDVSNAAITKRSLSVLL